MKAMHDEELKPGVGPAAEPPPPPPPRDKHDPESLLRTGALMVRLGAVLLIATFMGGIFAGAATTASQTESMAQGMALSENPLFVLGFFGGLALLVVGLVKKSNARRELRDRMAAAVGRSYRPVAADFARSGLQPAIDLGGADQAERQRLRGRASVYLAIGGTLVLATILGMLRMIHGGDADATSREKVETIIMSLGVAFFPFGLGLFFLIKGAIMKSNNPLPRPPA
jgi:hypothetical protein